MPRFPIGFKPQASFRRTLDRAGGFGTVESSLGEISYLLHHFDGELFQTERVPEPHLSAASGGGRASVLGSPLADGHVLSEK